MIVNKTWDDLQGRPNKVTTSYSEYYIEEGVKVERFNDGAVKILDTTSFGDGFKDIEGYQQSLFNSFGFKAGQLSVLIKGLSGKVAYLENISAEPETVNDLKKKIFDLKVEFEEIIHNFAIPKSETGVFSQKK